MGRGAGARARQRRNRVRNDSSGGHPEQAGPRLRILHRRAPACPKRRCSAVGDGDFTWRAQFDRDARLDVRSGAATRSAMETSGRAQLVIGKGIYRDRKDRQSSLCQAQRAAATPVVSLSDAPAREGCQAAWEGGALGATPTPPRRRSWRGASPRAFALRRCAHRPPVAALVLTVPAEVLAPSPRRDPFSPIIPGYAGAPTLSPDSASLGPSPGPPTGHFAEAAPAAGRAVLLC